MNNPGFYVYQGSSGDWYIDCLTSARDRIGRDLIRKTEGVWSTKQAAWDALDLALGVITPGEWTAPYTDVSTVTEYGLTQKLSNAVRVF